MCVLKTPGIHEFAGSCSVYLYIILHDILVLMDCYIVLHLTALCPAFIPYCVKLILLTVTVNMTEKGISLQTYTLQLNAICNPCSLMH